MDGLTAKFYQTFKEEKIPVPLKLLGSIEQELSLPEYVYEGSITPTAKADKDTTKQENLRSVSLMNINAEFLKLSPSNT